MTWEATDYNGEDDGRKIESAMRKHLCNITIPSKLSSNIFHILLLSTQPRD